MQGGVAARVGPRIVVYGLLTLVIGAGFASVEAWPLTSWKLFSAVRQEVQYHWEVVTVGAGGREAPADFGALPVGYRQAHHVLSDFASKAPAEQERLCVALADAFHREDPDTMTGVRIYRVRSRIRRGPDARSTPPLDRRLHYECAANP